MSWINALIDFILHIDVHLASITAEYGVWTYAILFIIIFAPIFAVMWTKLGKSDPSSPVKFAIGLILLGLASESCSSDG